MSLILLIEDDVSLSVPLTQILETENFQVLVAKNLEEARSAFQATIDLVILDWRLPDGQGIELLKEWRSNGIQTPVIMLTSRADLIDKVLGLELGADDYLTKPFESRELIARIGARLRKGKSSLPIPSTLLQHSEIEVDLQKHTASYQNHEIELTKTEFELLKLFLESPEQTFSREELLNRVWGYQNYPTTRTVDTHILQLRQKTCADFFITVHGVGYRFVGKK